MSGLFNEPPVSPTPPPVASPLAGGLRIAAPSEHEAVAPAPTVAAPAPAPAPTPIAASSIETLLLREKLVTPDQIAQAMTEQVQTGKRIEEIVRDSGWVSDADLARLLEHVNPNAQPKPAVVAAREAEPVVDLPVAPPAAPDPAPVATVEATPTMVAPPPAPTVEPRIVEQTPVAPAGTTVQVTLRLTNGERIAIASFDGEAQAKAHALELTREFSASHDWPFLCGRFIRPEAVVSVDITSV